MAKCRFQNILRHAHHGPELAGGLNPPLFRAHIILSLFDSKRPPHDLPLPAQNAPLMHAMSLDPM